LTAIIDRSSHQTGQLGCRYRTKWLTLYTQPKFGAEIGDAGMLKRAHRKSPAKAS
jgi:hypothetical protein